MRGKQEYQRRLYRQLIAENFRKYQECQANNKELDGTGLTATVPFEESLHRSNIITAFQKAAVPLSKIDSLRSHGEGRLTHSTH